MRLHIVHGDIETPEEQESLQAISQALSTHPLNYRLLTHGTNDTTTFEAPSIPESVLAMARACQQLYPHWRVTFPA